MINSFLVCSVRFKVFSPVMLFAITPTKMFLFTLWYIAYTIYSRVMSVIFMTMFSVIRYYKIFQSVIVFNAINMMYNFVNFKISANMLLYNPSMFKYITVTFTEWVIWFSDKRIAFFVFYNSAFPRAMFFTYHRVFKITITTHTSFRAAFHIGWSSVNNGFATFITLFRNHRFNYIMVGV